MPTGLYFPLLLRTYLISHALSMQLCDMSWTVTSIRHSADSNFVHSASAYTIAVNPFKILVLHESSTSSTLSTLRQGDCTSVSYLAFELSV